MTEAVSGRVLADARANADAAGARMERVANYVIERLIRRGYAERADVERLREADKNARNAALAVKAMEGAE